MVVRALVVVTLTACAAQPPWIGPCGEVPPRSSWERVAHPASELTIVAEVAYTVPSDQPTDDVEFHIRAEGTGFRFRRRALQDSLCVDGVVILQPAHVSMTLPILGEPTTFEDPDAWVEWAEDGTGVVVEQTSGMHWSDVEGPLRDRMEEAYVDYGRDGSIERVSSWSHFLDVPGEGGGEGFLDVGCQGVGPRGEWAIVPIAGTLTLID